MGLVRVMYCRACDVLFNLPFRIDRHAAEVLRPRLTQPWPASANSYQLELVGVVLGLDAKGTPLGADEVRALPSHLGGNAWRLAERVIRREANRPATAPQNDAGLAPTLGEASGTARTNLEPALSTTSGGRRRQAAPGRWIGIERPVQMAPGASAEVWKRILSCRTFEALEADDRELLGWWLDNQPSWLYIKVNDYGGRIDSYLNGLPVCPRNPVHTLVEWTGGVCPRCGPH